MAVLTPYDNDNDVADDDDQAKQRQEEEEEDDDDYEIDVDDLIMEIGRQHRRPSTRNNKIRICCPLTNQPFRDPVVHRRGVTFERDAVKEQFVDAVCYPNRALVEYLDPSTDPHIELQADSTEKKGIFYCSITSDLLRDPVIDPEGNTFERHAIVAWIEREGASPITRNPLSVDQLYDNTTLLTVLMQEVQQADDALNPEEIEDWKDEVSRVPMADPPLSGQELEQALRPPPVPNPPLAAIREALGPTTRPPALVPDPSLAALREALGPAEDDEEDLEENAQDPNTSPQPQPQPLTIQVHANATRRTGTSPSPQPLLLQELEQVQQDEAEERRLQQEADQHLNLLCKRHRTKLLLFATILVAILVGLFFLTFEAVGTSAPISFLIAAAIIICCCIGVGQYSLWG